MKLLVYGAAGTALGAGLAGTLIAFERGQLVAASLGALWFCAFAVALYQLWAR